MSADTVTEILIKHINDLTERINVLTKAIILHGIEIPEYDTSKLRVELLTDLLINLKK